MEAQAFLSGGGVCGELARSTDWAATPFGPPDGWPAALKGLAGTVLRSRHPMLLFWGAEYVHIYNDAYLHAFDADMHPCAMGQRGSECWGETWTLLEPRIEAAIRHGESSWNVDHHVPIRRHGRLEESFWSYSYSPAVDEHGVTRGVLVAGTETTAQVLRARREDVRHALSKALETLDDNAHDVTAVTLAALGAAVADLRFVLFVTDDGDTRAIRLGVTAIRAIEPWLAGRGREPGRQVLPVPIADDAWPEPITEVFVAPIDRTGSERLVLGLSARLPFDDGYRAFCRELAELVAHAHAQTQLARAQAQLVGMLDSMQDAFLSFDQHFVIQAVNREQQRLSQRDRSSLVGRSLYDVFPVPETSKYWTELHRVIEQRVPVTFEEYYAPLDMWTETRASPTAEGGCAIFYRDITARKRIELERDALLLRERASRVAAELGRAQAEAAGRMKDEFLSTVSHELRTPLNAMLGWAAMLRGGTLDAETREIALETIERNARLQARLIEDLLDLSRILQGKFSLAVGPVDLVRVVHSAIDAVRLSAEAKGVRLQRVLDSHAVIVGDPERLQQVVWNLLSNAIKFTPKGGRVQITLRCERSSVELSVADTGIGIAAEFLPHVFEPFRQADATTTRRSGGLGLGLSIVRTLVEMHGGTVTAASDGLDLGATFTIRMPMAPLRADRDAEAVAEEAVGATAAKRSTFEGAPELVGLRILVVDDERDTRDLLAYVLRRCEATVTTVASAAEAFEVLMKERFDLLVSDVGMPDEDGLSFVRRVRASSDGSGARLPALALTARARHEDRAQALRAGFNMHLAKPIEPSELVLVIASLARHAR